MSQEEFDPQQFLNQEYGDLIGRTIVSIRPLTEKELISFGWEHSANPPFLIALDNGDVYTPSSDYVGNRPGTLLQLNDYS